MPARRAATLLPPVSTIVRPMYVRRSTMYRIARQARNRTADTDSRPRTVPELIASKIEMSDEEYVRNCVTPWTYINAIAPYTRLMPNVMNSDSAWVSAPAVTMSRLLISPHPRPTEMPMRIAGPCPTLSISVTVTTATREMMPPIERSRNPAMMTKVIPRAAKISVPNCRTMLSKLAEVRNFGSTTDVTITSRAIATKIGLFLRRLMAHCEVTRRSIGSDAALMRIRTPWP